jgi:hypothetical protein
MAGKSEADVDDLALLSKPYQQADLAAAIRAALRRA